MALITLPAVSLKLSRANYSYWKPQVVATARAYGLDGYLFGLILAPAKFVDAPEVSTTTPPQLNPVYVDWVKKDQLLVSWLLASVSEQMLGHVARYSSAFEIWSVLEKLFQNNSKARVLQLRSQLHSLKKGSLSVDEYIGKMREIADDLAAVGQDMSDDELILYILEGVGSEYDAVVVNLTTRSEHFTIPEVQFALQTHEMRIQNSQL